MVDANSMDTTVTIPGRIDGKISESFWTRKLNITSFESDPWRWNKDWEKALRTLSSSKDVYPIMGQIFKKGRRDPSELSMVYQGFKAVVCETQNKLVKLWDEVEEREDFVTAWLLLEEKECKRYLLKGMEEACQDLPFAQDSRAFCPEVTVSSMLTQRGRAFVDFIRAYTKGKKDMGEDTSYALPNEWWDNALEGSPQSVSEGFEDCTFAHLTHQRNRFISRFLVLTVLSVIHDLCHGSAGMDPVIAFMNTKGSFARSWGKTLYSMRDKPLIRCENCTKSPEEIGQNVKFMMCSRCKSQLDLVVHYCSRGCQNADWKKHKKHCGKKKVSKNLQGTAQDPFWAFPEVPDHCRDVRMQDGTVDITSTGFAKPNPARPRSAALQRQVSLITARKDVDYFLFDEEDRPIPFVLYNMWIKMSFRRLRGDLLSNDMKVVGAIAEQLVKDMGRKPGLSRERILGQLEREYGWDIAAKLEAWEKKTVENGFEGSTFLEISSKNTMEMSTSMGVGLLRR